MPGDVLLQNSAFCFDASMDEIMWAISAGSRLALMKPGGNKDLVYLRHVMKHCSITAIEVVPSFMSLLLEELCVDDVRTLKQVISGGEAQEISVFIRIWCRDRNWY